LGPVRLPSHRPLEPNNRSLVDVPSGFVFPPVMGSLDTDQYLSLPFNAISLAVSYIVLLVFHIRGP
jgi:hypothetical protein